MKLLRKLMMLSMIPREGYNSSESTIGVCLQHMYGKIDN